MYLQYMYIFPHFALVETAVQSSWAHVEEEKKWQEEGAVNVRETQPTLSVQIEEKTQKQVEDGWFIQEDVSPKRTGKHSVI